MEELLARSVVLLLWVMGGKCLRLGDTVNLEMRISSAGQNTRMLILVIQLFLIYQILQILVGVTSVLLVVARLSAPAGP